MSGEQISLARVIASRTLGNIRHVKQSSAAADGGRSGVREPPLRTIEGLG